MKLTSTASPPFNRYSGMSGTITFTLGSQNGFDWPPDLVACASAIGFDLQSLNARNNDKVSWTTVGLPPFAQMTSQDSKLDANNSATFAYVTGTDTVPCGTQSPPDDIIRVTLKVQRAERDKLKALVVAFFDGQLAQFGQPVVTIIGPALHQLLDGIFNELAQIADPSAQRFVRIVHHSSQPCPSALPTPSLPPTPTPATKSCANLFPQGVPAALQEAVQGSAPGALFQSACFYGTGLTPDEEVATATLVVYPTQQAAKAAFDQGMAALGATRLSGIGDEAGLTTVDCKMPTKDENVTFTGTCGAVLKGAELAFIASRNGGSAQVQSLLRTAASRM
jgi:hypothetical protein